MLWRVLAATLALAGTKESFGLPFDSAFLDTQRRAEAPPERKERKAPTNTAAPEAVPNSTGALHGSRDAVSYQAEIASLSELINVASSQAQKDSLRVNRASA